MVTLYYRAPELLLGSKAYGSGVDMWSAGCVLAEMLNGGPLFAADTEMGMLTGEGGMSNLLGCFEAAP